MTQQTLFTRIIAGELPSDMLYQDDLVSAFRDIEPKRPTHVLIVPNEPIPTMDDISTDHEAVLGRMMVVASQLAREQGIAEDGYRLIINCGDHGRQEVMHIHMHLLGGADTGVMINPLGSA
jgi:histidine triad (HIT) family protein